jgi:plastocyanin
MRGVREGVVSVLAVASLVACGGGNGEKDALEGKALTDMRGRRHVTITAIDNSFRPPYVVVAAGTVVEFENRGRNPHNVLPVDDGAFTPIATDAFEPGASRSVTFADAGDYPFYCSLHGTKTAGMVGGIRVAGQS